MEVNVGIALIVSMNLSEIAMQSEDVERGRK